MDEISCELQPEDGRSEREDLQRGGGERDRRGETSRVWEIEEEEEETTDRAGEIDDGEWYVAIGRDAESSMDALQWTLKSTNSSLSSSSSSSCSSRPPCCVYLVHVFPPVTHIPTPVGKLAKSQVSQEQLRIYQKEENNRRRSLLQKYMRLCDDAKVKVDTVLIESNTTAKAILELIPVLHVRRLVIGTKRSSRWSKKVSSKAEFIHKNAPEFCEVTVVCDGKPVNDALNANGSQPSSPSLSFSKINGVGPKAVKNGESSSRQQERNFFECICFSPKFG